MSRHIHTPEKNDWVTFLANSAEIDKYLASENELYNVTKIGLPRPFSLSLVHSVNKAWDYIISDKPISVWDTADVIHECLSTGAVEGGFLNETYRYASRRREGDFPTPPDQYPCLPHSLLLQKKDDLAARILTLDEKAMDFLGRRFSTFLLQKELGMTAWLIQYQMAYMKPYSSLNGLTGRLFTNLLRLRWSMPIWKCDLKEGVWDQNLMQCVKLWKDHDLVYPLPDSVYKPSLKKFDPKEEFSG